MKMKFDLSRNEYTGDAVIERGYSIYDEWVEKSLSSRKIVARVESAVSAMKQKRTKAAGVYALACLFALDTRIKEKYNNIFRCLFSYFSWRRETRALNMLKSALDVPADVSDVRTAIEIQLAVLRERIDIQESDEDDDETHGGKRNTKTEDRSEATQEKQEDQITEDADKKISDAENVQEEASEEKTEEIAVKAPDENQIAEIEKKIEAAETVTQENEVSRDQEKEVTNSQTQSEYKEEINVFEEISETITDKTDSNKTYNAAVDSLPLDNEKSNADKLSFIDEVIVDNMIKGKEDYVRHNPLDDVRQERGAELPGTQAFNNEQINNADKDAYLYDEFVKADKFPNEQQAENAQNANVAKSQTQAPTQVVPSSNGDVEAAKQDFESFRVPLQVDITLDQENELRREISNNMSEEAIVEQYKLQADAMREQLEIASAELGIDVPVEIIGEPQPIQIAKTSAVLNKK